MLGCVLLPAAAMADLLSGNAEWSYSLLDTKVTRGTAASRNTSTDSFTQKYNVALNSNPFPHLRFAAGSLFGLDRNSSRTDGLETTSSVDTIFPFADLTLATTLYSAGVGYSRKQDTAKGTGSPRTTTINEEYHSVFGWKPEGFPSASLRLARTNNFDADRVSTNSTSDFASLGLRYSLFKGADLRYQTTYGETTDRINNVETNTLTNSGAVTYSGLFFAERVSLYTSYNFSSQSSETVAQGTAQVDSQLFPISGLSAINNTPTAGTPDQNTPTPALIDDNLTAPTDINIGVVPLGGDPTLQRSIGVDFFTGTEVNALYVWVDRGLPAAIASSFTWDIYIRGSETQDWTLWRTVPSAPFGPFQNRFVIRFDNVTTRFIKAVVTPLPQAIAAQNPSFQNPGQIFVTQLQAFISRPAQEIQGKSSVTSHFYNMDVRTRILNSPSLYHSLSFLLTTAGTAGSTRYSVSNTFNLSHRLSRIFSVGANLGFDLADAAAGQNTALVYNASIKATPLSGLSHSLLYSGRTESAGGARIDTNSVFLYNSIQPYRGISFNLSGGLSESTSSRGGSTESIQFIAGASVTPIKALNMSLSYSRTATTISAPSSSTSTQRGSLSAAYRMFPSLYLFTSFGISSQENTRTQYTQNYGVNWSPFSEGDLQFNFLYSESLNSSNDTKNTVISPSFSWKITTRTLLDVSYPIILSESPSQSSETTVFNATLRTSF